MVKASIAKSNYRTTITNKLEYCRMLSDAEIYKEEHGEPIFYCVGVCKLGNFCTLNVYSFALPNVWHLDAVTLKKKSEYMYSACTYEQFDLCILFLLAIIL